MIDKVILISNYMRFEQRANNGTINIYDDLTNKEINASEGNQDLLLKSGKVSKTKFIKHIKFWLKVNNLDIDDGYLFKRISGELWNE